jgi:hypothetical protein
MRRVASGDKIACIVALKIKILISEMVFLVRFIDLINKIA